MQNKFTEEFAKVTEGAFPMLKFKSATYEKAVGVLTVRFLISAFDARSFDDEMKTKVDDALKSIFNGVCVRAEYIRTFADESTVRNKIAEFFNLRNQMVFRSLTPENVSVDISHDFISVTLSFETYLYKILEAADTVKNLTEFLDENFNPTIEVVMHEKESASRPVDDEAPIDTVVVRNSSLRLIEAEAVEKIYTRGKVSGVNRMAAYIGDIKSAADSAVVCGRVSGVNKRTYKNKKFTPDNPKNGPEELPLVRFFLDDTTGRMECVCFPKTEEADAFDALNDGDEIVCAGKISLSSYNGTLSLAVNALFRAKIDFSCIKPAESKPTPARYTVLRPEPYTETVKKTLFDEPESKPVSSYFKGKTFVVFDFETTGLDISTIEPIEIGAAKVVDGKITETFSSLLDPRCPIPETVVEKTHITERMVQGMPTFRDVLPDFFKFTRGAVLVGHNISGFDFPLLSRFADEAGYVFDNEVEDTLILARRYITEARQFNLESLSKMFGITHDDAHRAMADVLATVDLLRVIADRM